MPPPAAAPQPGWPVRHIRVISDARGTVSIRRTPLPSIGQLITQKMGEKIKSKLKGGETKETVL